MEKVQQKALTFKNRLCFKDLNKDHKFKNNIKDKLKSLETFEEAEIVVEIPKLFGGRKSHV
jgi:FPC/CPF motif-containing protein YcgG